MNGLLQRARYWFKGLPQAVRWLFALQLGTWLSLVVVRLADLSLHDQVVSTLGLDGAHLSVQTLWSLLAHWWVHPSTEMLSLIVDLVLLVSLGMLFGHRWRRNHFLVFWFLSALFAALVHIGACQLAPNLFGTAMGFGSQGPVMALLAAFWLVFGEQRFRLWGIENPVKGKWVVLGVVVIQIFFFVLERNPFLAQQAGGLLAGWLLVTGRWRPARLGIWFKSLARRIRARRRGFRTVH